MNGIHDMGGLQDMGPIQYERNEPVFHAPWEGRVFALTRALAALGKFSIDASRREGERMPPAEYLNTSYYERRIRSQVEVLVKTGLVTRAEIESGIPAPGAPKATPALTAAMVPAIIKMWTTSAARDLPVTPRFKLGQSVRARNMHPIGHTRLPRYARGKVGVIERDHGVYVFPDTNAEFRGENPQHVYSVRFAARELWGEQASPRDAVYIDMWDDYLEPV
jgi:nitrile hydratase beta subunit